MIIKYVNGERVCKRLKEDLESYSYLEDCKDVTTEEITLDGLMAEFVRFYDIEDVDYSDWKEIVNKLLERYKKECKDSIRPDREILTECLLTTAETYKKYSRKFLPIVGDALDNIAEDLIRIKNLDQVCYADKKLKIINYRNNETWYTLYTLGTVYLLNDNGKTIDIIR